MFVFPYFFVCYIFTYNRKKKSIFKVFKYYCLIHNVKKQFIEADTEKRGGGIFNLKFSHHFL